MKKIFNQIAFFLALILCACQNSGKQAKPMSKQQIKAEAQVNEIYKTLLKDNTFELMAQIYSHYGDHENKTGLGWYKKGETVDQFYEVASQLNPNEFSKPFRNEHGYYIVKLLENKTDSIKAEFILIIPERLD